MKSSSKNLFPLVLICFFISSMLSVNYFFFVYAPEPERTIPLFQDIINGTTVSPYKYRILFPYALYFLQSAYEWLFGSHLSFDICYFILIDLCYFFSLYFSFRFFSIFHSRNNSIILTVLLGLSLLITHYKHFVHPWSMLEPALFSIGFLLAYQKKPFAFLLIVLLAVLNRETGIFLSAAYLFSLNSLIEYIRRPKLIINTINGIIFILLACTGYLALRLVLGESDHAITFGEKGVLQYSFNFLPYIYCYVLLICAYLPALQIQLFYSPPISEKTSSYYCCLLFVYWNVRNMARDQNV